jgi:hypothetical protein
LKRVDLPTFGSPTIPALSMIWTDRDVRRTGPPALQDTGRLPLPARMIF